MIEPTKKRTLAALLAMSLVAAACGGGGQTTAPATGTPSTPTTAPETAAPETTAPETTAPETTAPETTAPETTAPETTAPETTAPETTAPETTAPETTSPGTGEPTGDFTIGFSNPLGVGNGFREEQLCTAKAQALVSGQVTSGTWTHRNTDAAGQLSDIRDLIAADVDAIVFNPLDPEALNPALDEAQEAGIVTVAIDAYVTDPETYNLSNDQVAYARIGAEWLFEQIGGEGRVWYTRGIPGHPADNDRHQGVLEALENYPDIELWPSEEGVHTNWDPTTATNLASELVASPDYDSIAGIWTSGMDSMVVDAIQAAGKPFVPIVGADLRAFVEQLLNVSGNYEGLTGIAVYNPASVGGAGVELALRVLNGETVETTTRTLQDSSGNPVDIEAVFLPEPEAYDNASEEGLARLEEINVPDLDPFWPVSWQIEGWTDYDFETMKACRGPGE
jgi:ribose transport system substrate-binding protein